MSQFKDLSPSSSIRDQSNGSADLNLADDEQQSISLAPTPTNIIELRPQSRRNFISGASSLSCPKLTGGAEIRCRGSQLIALCEEFRALERLRRELWEMDDPNFWECLFARQQVLVGRIKSLPPRLPVEFQALARALTGWFPGAAPFDIDDLFGSDCELLSLLIRCLLVPNAN